MIRFNDLKSQGCGKKKAASLQPFERFSVRRPQQQVAAGRHRAAAPRWSPGL